MEYMEYLCSFKEYSQNLFSKIFKFLDGPIPPLYKGLTWKNANHQWIFKNFYQKFDFPSVEQSDFLWLALSAMISPAFYQLGFGSFSRT